MPKHPAHCISSPCFSARYLQFIIIIVIIYLPKTHTTHNVHEEFASAECIRPSSTSLVKGTTPQYD